MAPPKKRSFGQIDTLPSGKHRARYTGPDGHLHKAPRTYFTKDDAAAWLRGEQKLIEFNEWSPPATHKRSLIVWVSLTIPVSQVILSESRTAIIATAAAIIWALLRSGVKSIIVIAYAGVTLTLTVMAANWQPEGERFERFTATEGTGLLNSRTLAWGDVLNYVASNPFGVGWSATTATLSNFRMDGIGSGLSSIHNSYLQIIYELGWIGIIPVVLIVLALLRAILTKGSGLTTGLSAAALTGAIIQFTESAIFGVGQPYPYLFWFAVVAATIYPAVSRQNREEQEDVDAELRELVTQS